MTSLASVKGPSVTVILPLDSRARAPRAVGPRPPIPTITPCLLPSSPSFTILSMSAGDQLFGLRERAVTHGALGTRIRDARPLGRRLQSLTRQHHACLYQLVVELAHFGQHLLRRQDARLRVFIGFHHHEESHLALAFLRSRSDLRTPRRRMSRAEIDTH